MDFQPESSELQQNDVVAIEDIFHACLERIIPASMVGGTVVKQQTYWDCWNSILRWVRSQIDLGHSVNVAGLGIISHRVYNLGIRIPVFTMSSKFQVHYGLQAASSRNVSRKAGGPVRRMNHELIAQIAGVDKEIFTVVVANIFDEMGQMMQTGHALNIDFGVGSLLCRDRAVSFYFTQHPDSASSKEPKAKKHGPHGWGGGIGSTAGGEGVKSMRSLSHAPGLRSNIDPTALGSIKPMAPPSAPPSGAASAGGRRGRTGRQATSGIPGTPTKMQGGATAGFEPGSKLARGKKSAKKQIIASSMAEEEKLKELAIQASQGWRYPPMLDIHSRTLAASFDDERFARCISNKIGSHYSPDASLLSIDATSLSGGLKNEKARNPLLADAARGGRVFGAPALLSRSLPTKDTGAVSIGVDGAMQMAYKPAASWRHAPLGFDADAALSGKRCAPPPAVPTMPSLWDQSNAATAASQSAVLSKTAETDGGAGGFEPGQSNADGADAAADAAAALDRATEQRQAEIRYLHYLKEGVDTETVAAMREEWVVNVLELLPSLPQEPDTAVEKLLRRVLQEMKGDYFYSVKKAMLDYMLRSPSEKKRLGIAEIPAECQPEGWGWGEGKVVPDAPLFWRRNVELAHTCISERLLVVDVHMVEILSLWQQYSGNLLVDLPTTDEEAQARNWEPLTISEFKQRQLRHCRATTQQLLEEWHPAATAIFKDSLENGAFSVPNSKHEKYFEALAVLMSNHIRGLVMQSVDAMVAFFKRYESAHVVDSSSGKRGSQSSRPKPYSSLSTEGARPAFKVQLEVDEEADSVKFDTSPQDIKRDVLEVFENIIDCLSKVPRVEYMANLPFAQADASPNRRMELFPVRKDEVVVMEARAYILQVLEENFQAARQRITVYDEYQFLITSGDEVDEFIEAGTEAHKLEEYGEHIERFSTADKKLFKTAPLSIPVTLIQVQCKRVNGQLSTLATDLIRKLLHNISQDNIVRNLSLVKKYKLINTKLGKKPTGSEELVELEQYLENVVKVEKAELDGEVREVQERLLFLFSHGFHVTDELLTATSTTFTWVKDIPVILKEADDMLSTSRFSIEGRFDNAREEFEASFAGLETRVAEFNDKADMKMLWEYVDELTALKNDIQAAKDHGLAVNEEEERLGKPTTDFDQLPMISKSLEPYDKLWTTVAEYQKSNQAWTKGPVFVLDAEEVDKEVNAMWRVVYKLGKQLTEVAPGVASVAINVKERLDEFKSSIPLIAALCNKGLRDRHWQEMGQIIGFPIKPDDHSSLSRFQDLGVDKYLTELDVVSESASKQWSIEKTLNKMKEEFAPMAFELAPYKETGTYVLGGASLEEITVMLDDHIVKTQTMRGSPYAKPFHDEITDWDSLLQNMQDIIDEWTACQSTWLYLEPIFSSEDIMKQMPVEGQKFRKVDKTYRSIMDEIFKVPVCVKAARIPGVLDSLKESNILLEEIQKGLNAYLELKRLYFPRFFFLSNDELLEILAETKDPLRVQPHLKKCFDGLSRLEFTDQMTIVAMCSSEKEKVPFTEVLDPATARGAVEVWLLEVERVMRETLKATCQEAIADYPTKTRIAWTGDWPGQLVLNVSQLYWTKEFETAVTEEGAVGVSNYCDTLNSYLDDIIQAVRGELPKLARRTLSALTVIDVHARDVMLMLKANGVNDHHDFDWMSQLRYYWEDDSLQVKMINSILEYGYEYIGNAGRLVITPLTDRCYRTLMGALHLQYGGAPEGPAGTGKTETVKDLSKALARQCVVFNCSDQLDYLAMAKFFKGLASSGAWACFDEFNRITLEVLSVIAQQITQIQQAIAKRQYEFDFEGTHLKLRWTANVFITMNPGYAGRADLPDNLKVLFRTVAMMVPDYAMIAEIILMSFGYERAKHLSTKITSTYKLCSEQLSYQKHYDYGMRAVMAVIRAAGNLKRKYGEENEEILMLRAINDVNLAKFLSHDLPLFAGITSDLFPGIVLPEPDYKDLLDAVNVKIVEQKLQPEPNFIEKIVQLYEMVVVRHGLMVVGEPYAGKTCNIRTLAGALTLLCERKQMPCAYGDHELATDMILLNPKSVSMNHLYGCFDDVSHEWTDGVLAIQYRKAATADDGRRKWVIFDGPVDAIWIENMNTVLDDNKKLCLNSGEIIQMSAEMTMMFEPKDLEVASPATVSRCGMVFMEPHKLGWRPVVHSWYRTLPESIIGNEKISKSLDGMFEWLIDDLLFFVRRECTELAPTSEIMRVNNLITLFSSLIDEFSDDKIKEVAEKDLLNWIDAIFLFCLVWSVGGVLNNKSREIFDEKLRAMVAGEDEEAAKPPKKVPMMFPAAAMCYAYTFEKEGKGKWKKWEDTLDKNFAIAPTTKFSAITVPTSDTARYTFLADHLLMHDSQILFVGPTGTGKTIDLHTYLLALPDDKFAVLETQFSAQTSAIQTQDVIDAKLDKRRKGVFGPPPGKKMMIFVDDLNMPEVEEYGAQPPLELLRQFMDHGGWYDLKEMTFRNLVDVRFCTAMGPPGGGRNHITPRLVRHFNVVGMTEVEPAVLTRIYSTVMQWFVSSKGMSSEVAKLSKGVVEGTLHVFLSAIDNLLPTPAKSHYLFNLRDCARIVQGVCMVRAQEIGDDKQKFTRLWIHECTRVIADRLIDDDDKTWFLGMIKETTLKNFGLKFDDVCAQLIPEDAGTKEVNLTYLRNLLWGDYKVPGAEPKLYDEVESIGGIHKVIDEYLDEYNAMATKPMNLVMFNFAIEHTSRLARIFKIPGGNALLVGVGGSGRQSLSRLATYMAEFECFQIEISKSYGKNEWKEDIKKCLIKAGGEGKPTVFLFTDTQVKYESFVEDINNILNTGEIPNLFPADEKAQIVEMVRAAAKTEGLKIESPAEFYSFFLSRVRDNLHISLCFSPIGEAFRTRLRQFPSLINCCTIDWFTAWPEDALQSVSAKFLEEVEFKDDATRTGSMAMCIEFHTSTRKVAERFLNELRRNYYVTPTSYLELISTFKTLLTKKRQEVSAAKKRYDIGLDKLITTEKSVEGMQKELTDLQPVLVETTKEVEAMMVNVAKEQEGAEKIRVVVQADEAVAKGKADASNKIKTDCEADLAEAMPILHSALAALDTLNKNDLTEVKSMKSPPDGVRLTMEALCHFFDIKAAKIKDPNDPTKKIQDYWEPAKKDILGNPNLLKDLKAYDRDNIEPKVIKKMQPFMGNPAFDPEVVKKSSKAAHGLCCWARAMVSYDRVAKVVAPKKAKLAEAEAEFAEVMVGLRAKQAELKKVEDKLAELDKQLQGCVDKKKQLEEQIADCIAKLERAEKLIDGLGGEKTRWTEESLRLGEVYENLVSDVLLSAGVIAYLGAFTALYRKEIIEGWAAASTEAGLTPSEGYTLASTLGEPVKIRDWNICGLPSDSFSIENGIIVDVARRWPLMIDPQGQANLWVRNMEAAKELVVVKQTDADFLRQLELALQFGKPVLLENIGEELDSALEPVLLKQVFKKGGVMMIKLGEALVEYSDQFRFYMTTKMRNPHYLPEVSVKVTLLNFMITPVGLQEQMLGIVVAKEKPELEEEKNRLILESAENKKQLKEIEDKILHVLSSSSGNILDDSTAIEVLTRSKIVSNEIAEKQVIAEETEKRIDEARMGYTPVAIRASALFFCISDLANIEPTYQYSLIWFNGIFLYSIGNSEASSALAKRIDNLCDYFTYMLYKNVCRSLFEKDKLLFSFLLSVKILQAEHPDVTPPGEFRFLLTGGVVTGDVPSNPCSDWLPESSWGEFHRLSSAVPALAQLSSSLKSFASEWQAIYDGDEVHKADFPGPWKDVTPMQRLCIIRCIRPDRVVPGVQDFVVNLDASHSIMGQRFIEPPPFDLQGPFDESNSITPLIFILSPGSDPMLTIYKFAEMQGIPVQALSLGQGQGPLAEKMIAKGSGDGSWVILQNCHVYPSWMTTLERICEQMDINKNHERFRLWLTSYPSKDLPVAVLQNGVKLTNEPPKGIRANVLGSFLLDPVSDMEFFNGCPDPRASKSFHKLLYGLCFFHAIIQERRNFGPLGWNIPYEFNESDLRISVRQLQMFLNENADKEMPFKALLYITGQCNYGGRVTDPFDRTCLVAILETYYCMNILEDGYKLSDSGAYVAPEDNGYESTLDAIRALPLVQTPEVFGMHSNADITKDQGETFLMFESIMTTQARATGGSGDGPEATVDLAAADMLKRLPDNYDVELIQKKYPVMYEESMNTVLCQELIRFNGLLDSIRSSLTDVKKAIVGLVVMSAALDKVFDSVYDGKIPSMWKGVSYPSLKPLGGYFADLEVRLRFFQNWVDNGIPVTFWISGFFFTQAFLTGAQQNYARVKTIPIDTLGFTFKFMKESKEEVAKMPKPDFGVYTYGLFLEGARWNFDKMLLDESRPKELFTSCPVIWMRPWVTKDIAFYPHYRCPLYKTSDRRGILSTTGHSTNFVMPILTPSDQESTHWIKRGVAMLTQLDT